METKASITQTALRYGLILGFTQVAITLLAYIINKELLVSFWYGSINLVINITILVIAVKQVKKPDNFITFKDAFLICLISMIGAALLGNVFFYLLYNVIDPDLSNFMKEQTINKTVSMLEKLGSSEEDIAKAITPLEQQDFSQTPATLGKQFMWSALLSAIPASIIAAIMRTKQKPTDEIQ